MSKTLYLIRHAKSDWSIPGQPDFNRSLNHRGQSDAPMIGKVLKELQVFPELILSSPAERAKRTAEFVSEQLNYPIEKISYVDEIYEASPRTLLRLINNIDNGLSKVAIFGHNPTFTYLAEFLTKEELGNIPTAGAVKIQFELDDWAALSEGTGDLRWFEYPKKHKD